MGDSGSSQSGNDSGELKTKASRMTRERGGIAHIHS
jgi:hypothetical protein